MFVILYSLFAFFGISKQVQTTSSPEANDLKRLDSEYRFLERFIRMELDIQRLVEDISKGHASTYVRWGKTTCPGNDTELVYEGFAGGSYYADVGSAADFLCLPKRPTWGKNVGGTDPTGFIYGAEYELYSGSNPFSAVSIQDDVPCCVCRPLRTTTLMIPARTGCYAGWNEEYTGYLMSGHNGHPSATNYVCVDEEPEAVFRGTADNNGHLMYVVQAKCGSLPCPPYVEGRVIACVVCSK